MAMTYRERLRQEYPDLVNENYKGGYKNCPHDYGYCEKLPIEQCIKTTCTECWNREMPSKVQQVNVEPICDDVKAAYEQGLNDASDAVIELVNLSAEELESVFECSSHEFVIENISMKNIIAKLKAHEESQKIPFFHRLAVSSMGMTEQEAIILHIKQCRKRIDTIQNYVETYEDADVERCGRNIFILESTIKALEKQIPKKPIDNDLCTCPNCHTYNEVIKKRRNTVEHDVVYCWHCGRALEVTRLGE